MVGGISAHLGCNTQSPESLDGITAGRLVSRCIASVLSCIHYAGSDVVFVRLVKIERHLLRGFYHYHIDLQTAVR